MASAAKKNSEIESLVATLAGRQHEGPKPTKQLTGPERAAVLMLALGEQHGAKIWGLLDDDDLRQISIVMSTLGNIDAQMVEALLLEFVGRLSASGAILGNYDATERLLQQYLPPERVGGIMDEIRGPAGRNMWEKLANVQEEVLANYLKNEYPQTVAVVLSKLRPEHSARVLAITNEVLQLEPKRLDLARIVTNFRYLGDPIVQQLQRGRVAEIKSAVRHGLMKLSVAVMGTAM